MGRPIRFSTPRKRLTIELPTDLVEEVYRLAAPIDFNLREAVEDALNAWVYERKKAEAQHE